MNYKRFIFAIIILMIILLGIYFINGDQLFNDKDKEAQKAEGTEFIMNTFVRISIYDKDSEVVLSNTFRKLRYLENIFSKTIEESDINKLNNNAGIAAVEVNKNTYDILKESHKFAEITEGSFDPTIGPLISLWGIGTDDQKVPTENEIRQAVGKVNYKDIEFLDSNRVYLKKSGMSLDLGAIAKGYAADNIIEYYEQRDIESAYINMGGNIYVYKRKADNSLWKIGIRDPDQSRGGIIAILNLEDTSVVTSGNYERYFLKDGVRYHHIINPETGYPAKNGIISSTVISHNSSYADALSTSFYILGVERSFDLVEKLKDIKIILLTEDNKAYVSEKLKAKVEFTVNGLEIIYR